MRDSVVFHINGREYRVRGAEIFTTLANWVRDGQKAGPHLTGTKIVCEEGDCGACTVLVRRSAAEDLKPLNSCIPTRFQTDAASIVTIECLRFNAAQHAIVAHHAA